MSEDTLTIERITASAAAREADDEAMLRSRLPRLLDQTGRRSLPSALVLDGPDTGHTCIRRVHVSLPLDPDEPDTETALAWAAVLAGEISSAVRRHLTDVVRYDTDADALTDLVVSAASGDWDRAWAWRQVGLLGTTASARSRVRDGAQPALGEAREIVLRALDQRPDLDAAVVGSAVRQVGAAALTRILGESGWQDLATRVAEALGSDVRPQVARGAIVTRARPSDVSAASSGPTLEAFSCCLVRPSVETRLAWAIVALAADAPEVLLGEQRHDVVAAVAAGLTPPARAGEEAPLPTRATEPATAESSSEVAENTTARSGTGASADPEPDQDPARVTHRPTSPGRPGQAGPDPEDALSPDRDESEPEDRTVGAPSVYAGLLFLLATADDAGLPDLLTGDPWLGTRPLTWSVPAVARRVSAVPADDPALLALAGAELPEDPWLPESGSHEARAIREAARAWRSATAQRLREYGGTDVAATSERTLVRRVVRRRGLVIAEPGWVEVRLDAADTDVLLRRAGLDLDPGWVPWLGSVVRFRYE